MKNIRLRKKRPNGYWTKERCLKEAKKYNTQFDWNKNSGSSYFAANREGWLRQCCRHMKKQKPKGYWTKERCFKEAKKYKTTTKWIRANKSSYDISQRNGWFEEFTSHMIKKGGYYGWNIEDCINSAKKYKTRNKWQLNDFKMYQYALKYKWLEKCCEHMPKRAIKWTKESCLKEAKKHKTRSKFYIKASGAYSSAKKNKWLEECSKHMKHGTIKWTKEECIKLAKECYNKTSFKKAYKSAKNNGWLNECYSYINKNKENKKFKKKEKNLSMLDLKELCLLEAKKYKNENQWIENDVVSYILAILYNYFDECCEHMK